MIRTRQGLRGTGRILAIEGSVTGDRLSTFFDLVHQDPVVSNVKLIAEPFDVGEGGYQIGNFPPLWTEWNGKYRDAVRDFWRGQPHIIGEFASRLAGSSDLYAVSGRRPFASVNFVTCHDGFTLHDLVSCNRKHNEANGDSNGDGTEDNRSWNNGGAISEPGPRGERITDARFLLLFNAHPEPVTFVLPEVRFAPEWAIVIDTDGPRIPAIHGELPVLAAEAEIEVGARSVIVLSCRRLIRGPDTRQTAAETVPAWLTGSEG